MLCFRLGFGGGEKNYIYFEFDRTSTHARTHTRTTATLSLLQMPPLPQFVLLLDLLLLLQHALQWVVVDVVD